MNLFEAYTGKRQRLDEKGNKKEIEDEEEEEEKTGNITQPAIASQLTPYSIVRDL